MVAQTEKDKEVGNYWLCASLLPRVRGEGRFKFSEGEWRKNSFSRGVIKGLKAFFPEKKKMWTLEKQDWTILQKS